MEFRTAMPVRMKLYCEVIDISIGDSVYTDNIEPNKPRASDEDFIPHLTLE